MVNVYQIKLKREIYITDYLEVNENLDLQDEEVKEALLQSYCSEIENSSGDVVENSSLEFEQTDKKPNRIFSLKPTGHYEDVYDEDGYYIDEEWRFDKNVGDFSKNFTPKNTRSVLYFRENKFRRTMKLPNSELYFYFSIEEDELKNLWENGKLKKLSEYLIQPTDKSQRNPANRYIKIVGQSTDINTHSSEWFKEMYKRRGNESVDIYFLHPATFKSGNMVRQRSQSSIDTGFFYEKPFGSYC